MVYLYLDESGDLGFDFITKKPSKFFTVSILVVKGSDNNRMVINAVKNTLRRKLRKRKTTLSMELKGSKQSLEIKKYFYSKVEKADIKIYALTLNKKRVNQSLRNAKSRLYNFIARKVLDEIDLNCANQRVIFTVDKSKGKSEIVDFNRYIIDQIKGKLDPKIPLDILHKQSHEILPLQAVDLFAWGVFRKYERKDYSWYEVFEEKVIFDDLYLP